MVGNVEETLSSLVLYALRKSYAKTHLAVKASNPESSVMRAMRNKNTEFQSVGVLNSQARQFSPIKAYP